MTITRPANLIRLVLVALGAGVVLGSGLSPARAGEALVRQERLVHRFDFQETDEQGNLLGRGHQWPPYWYGIGRPPGTSDPAFLRQPLHDRLTQKAGFPRYTRLGYDARHATSGPFSFHIGLDGGNAGAFLEVGAVPAVPGSDYLITAQVRTERLELARGFLTAYFIDGEGEPIEASVVSSEPLATHGQWTTIAVKLAGDVGRAAWIGLELSLRQPISDPMHALGAQQIVLQDVEGDIWFDDISIWQVPHISVRTQSPVNLIRAPAVPRVESHVRDVSGRRLTATLSVFDHRMTRVDRRRFAVGQGAPMRWEWTPDLPALGWYLLELTVHDHDDQGNMERPVARTLGAMLWLPDHARLHEVDRHRFALPAEDVPDAHWPLLPAMLKATGIERTSISAWQRGTTMYDMDDRVELIDELLQAMAGIGGQFVISLHPLPDELAEGDGTSAGRPLEVLTQPIDLWRPYLAPILVRHGPRVRQWALGLPSEAVSVYDHDLPQVLDHISNELRRMAPRPRLVVPWRLDQARRADLDRSPAPESLAMDIDVPPGIVPRRIPEHLEPWNEPRIDYRLSLRTAPADEMSHPRRVTDLALRMIHSWSAAAEGEGAAPAIVQLRRPWTDALHNEPGTLPDPLLGVFTNVAHQLAGRRVLGELPLAEGLRGLILDGPAGGALVAWNRSAPPRDAELRMYLGEQPMVCDVWGNVTTVPEVDGVHHVTLDETPFFITGIDPELALFRAGFRVEPRLIESLQVPHERTIELTNPWPRTISGHMHILGPEGWQHQPSRHYFSIPAGKTLRLPLRMQFPIAEVAGPKALRSRFEFTADQEYRVEMSAPMELGLPDVEFDASVSLETGDAPDARDAVVTCIITNRGDETQALFVFANLVGHARQERLIAQLEPGESVVRRFRFPAAEPDLRQHAVRAGVRETAGPAILNYRLTPDDAP